MEETNTENTRISTVHQKLKNRKIFNTYIIFRYAQKIKNVRFHKVLYSNYI